MVKPVGFWKLGIKYINLGFGFSLSAFSKSSKSNCPFLYSMPLSSAPNDLKAFKAPKKLGFSQMTTSPSLHKHFAANSIICCEPDVIII